MKIETIFDKTPDVINEECVKWWLDKDCTQYAKDKDIHGISLPKVLVYAVEKPDGYRTRLIIDGGTIVFESQKLEDIGVHIDIMKANLAIK